MEPVTQQYCFTRKNVQSSQIFVAIRIPWKLLRLMPSPEYGRVLNVHFPSILGDAACPVMHFDS